MMIAILTAILACEPEVRTEYVTKTEIITQTEEVCGSLQGRQPCDFMLVDIDGNEVNFHSLIGKPVILDLSTMWCYPCNAAAAEVQETQDAYPELTYVTILIENRHGVDPTQPDLKDWEETHDITTAPVWAGSREVITQDPTDSTEFYLRSWPTFYFLDEDLRIVGYERGFDQAVIESWAEELLKEE